MMGQTSEKLSTVEVERLSPNVSPLGHVTAGQNPSKVCLLIITDINQSKSSALISLQKWLC